jgi:stage II sporulation protein D
MRTRSKLELLLCWLLVAYTARAQDVRIGVFGLFHPRHLVLESPLSQALVIQAGDRTLVLERSSGQDTAAITSSGDVLIVQAGSQTVRAYAIRVTNRSGTATDFMLAVPGKINRRYRGQLEVTVNSGSLVPVVNMELETAVASVVQAESDPDSPLEAMKAQSVATRSYLAAARGRHHSFDFCDTTHCEFLRESPPPDSGASRAAVATRGLVLGYRDQPVAAMFTRSCGGRTRTPEDVGMAHQTYPYFSVVCDYCRRNPARWTRHLTPAEAADLRERGEASRLDIDRRFGWDAVPSNTFTTHDDVHGVLLEGTGEGHGIGLCQKGAKSMAQSGATFRQILDHYYPNTAVVRADQTPVPTPASIRAKASTP